MKGISINSILKEANCRISDNNLTMTRDGELYRIGKIIAENGKEADGILIDNDICENDAKLEFLRNYIRSGSIKDKTRRNIVSYINKVKKEKKQTKDINEKNIIDLEDITQDLNQEDISKYKNSNSVNYLDKFKYNPYSYEIEKVIKLVVESRVRKISPYSPSLMNKYNVKADGTIYAWYRDLNEYRILYTLYTLDYKDIKNILINYNNEEIRLFEEELKKDINNNYELQEYIKIDFLEKINNRIQAEYNENIPDESEIIFRKKLIDIILNEEEPPAMYSKEYIINKRKEILKLAIENEVILNTILENINFN